MKNFIIDVDFVLAQRIQVEAEDEVQAKETLNRLIKENPYDFIPRCDEYLSHEIKEVNDSDSDDDTDPTLKAAVEYVHQTIDAPTLAIIRAKIDKNYEMHLNPACGIDTSQVEELLNEYGDTYLDAPEEWWEQYADIDDILLML